MSIKKRLFHKINWKKGSGELLGFVCIAPFVLLLICAVVASAQIGIVNQDLNYCAYNAGRSAVISNSLSVAETRANQIYAVQMGTKNAEKYGYTPCTIEVLGNAAWEKGMYIKCTVRYYVETLMPFTSGIREESIVMMIENGG